MLNFSFHFNFLSSFPSFISSQSKSLFSFLSKHKKKEDKPSYFLVLCKVICSDKQGQVVYSLNQHVFSLFENNIKETIPSVISSSINLNTPLCLSHNNTFSLPVFTPLLKNTKSLTYNKSSPWCCGVFVCCLSITSTHSFQHKSSQNNHQTLLLCVFSLLFHSFCPPLYLTHPHTTFPSFLYQTIFFFLSKRQSVKESE